MKSANLHEVIRRKFKSDAAFALAIGWTPAKVYKLLHCGYVPKLGEAVKISRALDITLDALACFFAQ